MADRFPDDVAQAVLRHMNDDHAEDNLVIVRGNGAAAATAAEMIDLDTEGGTWLVTEPDGERELIVEWPEPVVERADIRVQVVALYEAAKDVTS